MFNFLKKQEVSPIVLYAPISGELMPLEAVNDPVFAEKMMGDGIAIQGNESTIVAPADGEITIIADTLHAFGMRLSNDLELLVHVGLETVNLQGSGFQIHAKVGQKVKKGTPILTVDLAYMKQKHIDLVTPFIIINHQDYTLTPLTTQGQVVAGQDALFQID